MTSLGALVRAAIIPSTSEIVGLFQVPGGGCAHYLRLHSSIYSARFDFQTDHGRHTTILNMGSCKLGGRADCGHWCFDFGTSNGPLTGLTVFRVLDRFEVIPMSFRDNNACSRRGRIRVNGDSIAQLSTV
jgi:hypothetical protein